MNKDTDIIREFFKRWPRFYYFMVLVFGPALFVNLSAKGFLEKFPRSGKTINVGSGPRVLASGVINVDVTAYDTVDIVASAEHLPFDDNSISRLVYDNVLEHIPNPEKAIAETARVLEYGGYAYFAVPFMYPFHASPNDYTRWTMVGLKSLFERHRLSMVESGVRCGQFSIVVLWFSHLVASILCFGNRSFYLFLLNVTMVMLFPIKLLDVIAARLPFAEEVASVLYIVVRKE